MTPERRTNARGSAVAKVTLTDATADKTLEGQLHDIGRGGLFVASTTQLPVGKRVDVEVHAAAGTIAGMGRVIWIRDSAQGDLPAGMGVKFIDVDNEALLAIDRLVGLKKNVRERTVLGMMAPTVPAKAEVPKAEPPKVEPPKPEPPKVEAPKVEAPKAEAPRPAMKPPRERTMLGIAPPAPREKELSWPDEPPEPPPEPEPVKAAEPVKEPEPEPVKEPDLGPVVEQGREVSIPLELLNMTEPEPVKEPEPEPAQQASVKAQQASVETQQASVAVDEPPPPRELPKREGGGGALKWIVLLVVIVGVGVGVYFMRDVIFPGPQPGPSASTSSAPSAQTSASASASASAAPSETVSASAIPVADLDAAVVEAPLDASTTAQNGHDAGHDAGDAGHHHHDAGVHHVHPKPSAGGGTDNPY